MVGFGATVGVAGEAGPGAKAGHAVLNAVGRLSPQLLHLAATGYDPSVHYQQVPDNWFGVRTPGR